MSSSVSSLQTINSVDPSSPFLTTVHQLPEEILEQIFDHLSIQDRIKLRQICRQWRRLSFYRITELQVGRIFSNYPRPAKYEIHFKTERAQLEVLRTIVQETGYSLRFLALGTRVEYSAYHEDWSQLFAILKSNCPNLIGLYLGHWFVFSKGFLGPLIRNLGPQLKKVFLYNKIDRYELFDIAMHHFDPTKMREMSITAASAVQLERLVDRFPLLTYFYLLECIETQESLDFRCLHRLRHLRNFEYYVTMTKYQFDALLNAPFVANLQTLHLYDGAETESYEAFKRLTSLRRLIIRLGTGKHLPTIISSLPTLEYFQVTVCDCRHSGDLIDALVGLSSMQRLKELEIFWFSKNVTNFGRLKPMPSITKFSFQVHGLECSPEANDLWLESLPTFLPNVHELVILYYGIKVLPETFIECLIRLPKLRKLRASSDLRRSFKQSNELQNYFQKRNIVVEYD